MVAIPYLKAGFVNPSKLVDIFSSSMPKLFPFNYYVRKEELLFVTIPFVHFQLEPKTIPYINSKRGRQKRRTQLHRVVKLQWDMITCKVWQNWIKNELCSPFLASSSSDSTIVPRTEPVAFSFGNIICWSFLESPSESYLYFYHQHHQKLLVRLLLENPW